MAIRTCSSLFGTGTTAKGFRLLWFHNICNQLGVYVVQNVAERKENMGTVLRQVAKKFPRPFFSYQNLRLTWARMSIAAGKFPEAEMILRQAMVAEPQAPDILTILGAVLWLQGQLQQALDTLKGGL